MARYYLCGSLISNNNSSITQTTSGLGPPNKACGWLSACLLSLSCMLFLSATKMTTYSFKLYMKELLVVDSVGNSTFCASIRKCVSEVGIIPLIHASERRRGNLQSIVLHSGGEAICLGDR